MTWFEQLLLSLVAVVEPQLVLAGHSPAVSWR